jgi:hypothetical protein
MNQMKAKDEELNPAKWQMLRAQNDGELLKKKKKTPASPNRDILNSILAFIKLAFHKIEFHQLIKDLF